MIERRLNVEQAGLLAALDCRIRSPAWAESVFRAQLSADDHEVWGVMAEEGTLVAYLALTFGPFDGEIEMLGVAPQWRRLGIGDRLVRRSLARLVASGRERLLLEVRAGNQAALALYARHGFRPDGRRRGYYPPAAPEAKREDAVLMSVTPAG